jgi:TPR repeat protein
MSSRRSGNPYDQSRNPHPSRHVTGGDRLVDGYETIWHGLPIGRIMRATARTLRRNFIPLLILLSVASTAIADEFSDASRAYTKPDYATALRLIRPLADQGDTRAQILLGNMYRDGKGVQQSDVEAFKWYLKAANENDPNAQYLAGNGFFQKGNNAEALKWYWKSAEQGYGPAQYELGNFYEKGFAVPQNYILAYMRYTLAALEEPETYRASVKERLDVITAHLAPSQIAEAQKLAREWRAK